MPPHKYQEKIMNKPIRTIISGLIFVLLLSSCKMLSIKPTSSIEQPTSQQILQPVSTVKLLHLPLINRLAWPKNETVTPARSSEILYSFIAQNLPITQALQIFAKAYDLNIITDSDASGTITVQFHDLPFDQAMEAMLDSQNLYWEREHNLISVKSWETRNFTVNYIRLVRGGSGSAQSKVSSGSSKGGSDEGSGGESGAITITQEDTVEFWKELEAQLAELVSDEGRLIVNRLSGTVQVSDRHPRVMEVERYITQINQAVHRQVDIDVKIVEVSLNDDFSLGVDWTRIADGDDGINTSLGTTNIIAQPAGGFSAKLPSLALSVFNIKNGARSISAVIDALQEQGNVKVVSQPKIRTLNNQAAMVKVGTDRTFFRREVSTDSTSAGSITTVEDVPQLITEGITLGITPQISTDGWIMMDVSPVITRVSSVTTISDSSGNIQSSAPNLDIRQTSSLIRSRSGETVVIGGLIQDQNSTTERSVPILGDIPFLGRLFKGTYKTKLKKELIMFVTARLVNPRSQLSAKQ